MLSDARDCGLRMRWEDTWLRVDHPKWAEYERLVLRGRYRWYCRVPRERRCTNITMTTRIHIHINWKLTEHSSNGVNIVFFIFYTQILLYSIHFHKLYYI